MKPTFDTTSAQRFEEGCPEPTKRERESNGPFPETGWTQLKRGGRADPAALEVLCREYRGPLLAYARYHSNNHRDAEDIVQSFMVRTFNPELLATMDPQEGRFRSFLKLCLKRYIRDQLAKIKDHKKVSLGSDDLEGGERPLQLVSPEASPDQVFDREFALEVVRRTMVCLQTEYGRRGQGERFALLRPLIVGKQTDLPQDAVAERLGISRGGVGKAVFDMRREFKELFRKEVSGLVASLEDLDSEILELMNALATKPQ